MEDGYEFFAKRQLVTLFSAPNYCGEFDNAGAMMSVDETLMCSFQVGGTFLLGSPLGSVLSSPAFLFFGLFGVMASGWRVLSLWQILKPADKKKFPYGGIAAGGKQPATPKAAQVRTFFPAWAYL